MTTVKKPKTIFSWFRKSRKNDLHLKNLITYNTRNPNLYHKIYVAVQSGNGGRTCLWTFRKKLIFKKKERTHNWHDQRGFRCFLKLNIIILGLWSSKIFVGSRELKNFGWEKVIQIPDSFTSWSKGGITRFPNYRIWRGIGWTKVQI